MSANVGDKTEAIADLLMGDSSPKKKKEEQNVTQDLTDDDSLSEELTEEIADSDTGTDADQDEGNDTEEDEDLNWSSVLGIDESKLAFDEKGNVAGVKTKVDGKEAVVKLNDLVAGYQTNKYVTQKAQSLAAEKRTLDEQKQMVTSTYTERLENINRLTQFLESKLVGEYKGVDWQRLRAQNPAEYVALQHDYQQRVDEIKRAQQAIAEDYQLQQQELMAESQNFIQSTVSAQFNVMLEKNPAWADAEKRDSALKELRSFAINKYGFTDADMNSIRDARIIEVLKDALRATKGAKVVEESKLKTVPTYQKSGGKKSSTSKLDQLVKRAKAAKGPAKRDLQADAISQLLRSR
jgi:hypothetical protein